MEGNPDIVPDPGFAWEKGKNGLEQIFGRVTISAVGVLMPKKHPNCWMCSAGFLRSKQNGESKSGGRYGL